MREWKRVKKTRPKLNCLKVCYKNIFSKITAFFRLENFITSLPQTPGRLPTSVFSLYQLSSRGCLINEKGCRVTVHLWSYCSFFCHFVFEIQPKSALSR
jgi:hypothetical protein